MPFSASASGSLRRGGRPGARAPCAHRASRRSRRARQAAAEPRAFLVGPVDQVDGQRRRALRLRAAQDLEPGEHAEAAVEPAARRDRVEVTARSRCSASSAPGSVAHKFPAPSRTGSMPSSLQLGGEPRARLAPAPAPTRRAARRLVIGRQGTELLEIRNHALRRQLHRPTIPSARVTLASSARHALEARAVGFEDVARVTPDP